MGRHYSIGQIADLLGVKAHVLRYWEAEIPLVAPRKDLAGRRVYTEREVALLLRLKKLLHEDRYTIEGARERIWLDLNPPDQSPAARIAAVRRELLAVWSLARGRPQ
jgi:DNA-binding transcriptional MerR regulator